MSWIHEHIASLEKRPALVDSNGEFLYCQLFEIIEKYSEKVDRKIQNGEIVVIHSDYNVYSIALLIALLEKKCLIVPVVTLNKEELEKRLEVAQCDWFVQLHGSELKIERHRGELQRHDLLKNLIDIKHAGLILFSSGSTGTPKAMVHDLDKLVDSYRGRKKKRLNILIFLMFDHIGGLNTLFSSLSMGARIILPENRTPDYIGSIIERYKIHLLPSTPTFLNMILMARIKEKFNFSSLKMITYGTESMPESLLTKLKHEFPNVRLMQTFGTSETGIAKTKSKSSGSLEMKFDDPDLEYKVVEGELWLRSKTQVMGYLNASPESFNKEGWFKTGDLVEEFDNGYIRIIGRNKEIINVGGEKVLPSEVESVILELDEVADCMVYGEKNAITGQMVAVQLVIASGIERSEAKRQVRKYCRKKLEPYKIPAKFIFTVQTDVGDRFKKLRLNKKI